MNSPTPCCFILASGRGSNAETLAKTALERGFDLRGLISDRADAPVLARMQKLGVPHWCLPFSTHRKHHESCILDLIRQHCAENDHIWIFLAGYKRLLTNHFLKAFYDSTLKTNRVVNIHPSLLPDFPGLNAYAQAHRAKVWNSGCSVHFVDEGMDTGPMIAQESFEAKPGCSLEEYQAFGLTLEHRLYPQVFAEIMSGQFRLNKRPKLYRFEVWPRFSRGQGRFYKIAVEGATEELKEKLAQNFYDPQCENLYSSEYPLPENASHIVEVGLRPGVTDNTGRAGEQILSLLGVAGKVFSGRLFLLNNAQDGERLEDFGNPLVENIQVYERKVFAELQRFQNIILPTVERQALGNNQNPQVALDKSDADLEELSRKGCLALNLSEMRAIRAHFERPEIKENRRRRNLPAWPTQLELEVLAQTWSEHCKHKIFAAHIDYSEGKSDHSERIPGLYPHFIKRLTRQVIKKRGLTWARSVFSDNAGVVRFDSRVDLCIKVETHNAPSALDPYGGALTGILGVNRDILGCGMGARPIANTDVFCVASGELPQKIGEKRMPAGIPLPAPLLKGVHRGVQEGGNKSGIPTVGGAMHFDANYAGRPLVFCGTVGVMPQTLEDGREGTLKDAKAGDLIVVIGGAVGADGIHGATFSSQELRHDSPATAVQIGDPITQKRVNDFLVQAQKQCLYNCITDNGAGGLASSVGEMATLTGGARLDLSKCPLKYPGLAPWEIMISESQERMTLAIPPKNWEAFLALARDCNVEAHSLGEFNDSGLLEVFFAKQLVGLLDLEFLHRGVPSMELKAVWNGPKERPRWFPTLCKPKLRIEDLGECLLKLLASENIASKAAWVEQYDQEVQAATYTKPFVGKRQRVPGDGAVLGLAPHGGEETNAIAIGHGLAPTLSLHDPYIMAQYSVDEAIRNVVAAGGEIQTLCLLDNFCWPDPVQSKTNPEGVYRLGQLVRTCRGLYDTALAYGTPLVSGKDSMKNNFKGFDREGRRLEMAILPTLLITAMAKTDVRFTTTPEFQNPGDVVYCLGGTGDETLLGSELAELFELPLETLAPLCALDAADLTLNARLYQTLHASLSAGEIQSCHDVSEGGILTALCEGLFEGGVGLDLQVETPNPLTTLFHQGPGRMVVSVSPAKESALIRRFAAFPMQRWGVVTAGKGCEDIRLQIQDRYFRFPVPELYRAWRGRWP